MDTSKTPDGWHLGLTSSSHESNGDPGTISPGHGDHGGVSYGTYQLSTKMGTLHEYLHQSQYRDDFHGLTPTTHDFDAKWRDLARTDPGFGQDQHSFIKHTHYDAEVDALKKEASISPVGELLCTRRDLEHIGADERTATTIFEGELKEKFRHNYKLSELSDKDIVGAVQDYKIGHSATLV